MTIVFHDGCADGIISKEIIRCLFDMGIDNYPRQVNYFAFQYNCAYPKRILNSNSIWVDCSPPNDDDFELGLKNNCIYIDHHETVKERFLKFYQKYPDQLLFGETLFGNSGASLSYAFACKKLNQTTRLDAFQETFERISQLVAIADTWQSEHKDFAYARAVSSLIAVVGNDVNIPETVSGLLSMGRSFMGKKAFSEKKKSENVKILEINNLKVAILNDSNISDLSEILRNREENPIDITVGFIYVCENNNFKVIYNLRSNDKFDCSHFAKANGGGGHIRAAGFSISLEDWFGILLDPIEYFQQTLWDYLNTKQPLS